MFFTLQTAQHTSQASFSLILQFYDCEVLFTCSHVLTQIIPQSLLILRTVVLIRKNSKNHKWRLICGGTLSNSETIVTGKLHIRIN